MLQQHPIGVAGHLIGQNSMRALELYRKAELMWGEGSGLIFAAYENDYEPETLDLPERFLACLRLAFNALVSVDFVDKNKGTKAVKGMTILLYSRYLNASVIGGERAKDVIRAAVDGWFPVKTYLGPQTLVVNNPDWYVGFIPEHIRTSTIMKWAERYENYCKQHG